MLLKLIYVVVFICLLLNFFLLYSEFDEISFDDEKFLHSSKCPICYGRSLCQDFEFKVKNNFVIDDDNGWTFGLLNTYFLEWLFNVKNVYFARETYSNRRVVIKKLGHDSELENFDLNEKQCLPSMLNSIHRQNSKIKINCISDFTKPENQAVLSRKLNAGVLRDISFSLDIEVTTCFTNRLVDLVYENYFEAKSIKHRNKGYLNTNLYLMTSLKINPEPIVLQMFGSMSWPFPKYIGSCGRVIVESYEGLTLNHYLDHSFSFRSKIARKLLEALMKLTYNRQDIAVYLLDLGIDNIAYNTDRDDIVFIDAENLLIVDKRQIKMDNKHKWNETSYFSAFDDCNGIGSCLKYDIKQMCSSYHVDLNIYSVCRNLLSKHAIDANLKKNFLHTIPVILDLKYNISYLLDQCAAWNASDKKNDEFKNRFEIAQLLIKHLGLLEN